MHALQRSGNRHVQTEIDRYLFACTNAARQHLVLPRNHVPHYDNLPDISHYAVGILDPLMDTHQELQQVLLLLRQCTPLRRRTKRAQREVQWRVESTFAMQTLIRCCQGTLLGLYPNCLKTIAFGARVGILHFLRSVLVMEFKHLHLCMQKIRYITKLCIMEHICNTVYDYHPGICHTLNQSGQKVEHFCNSVSSICDIFRGELNTLFCASTNAPIDTILTLLPQLERIAHSYFERCTRAYRGIIIGHMPPIRNIDHARQLAKIPKIFEQVYAIMDQVHAASTQSVFDMVHQHLKKKMPKKNKALELMWYITQIIHVFQLPHCVMQRQLEALSHRYNGDTSCIQQCRILHLCIQCVIRKGNAQNIMLRHDCNTNEYVCAQCNEGSVLALDMLGRVAVVGSDVLILSSCCGSFVHYTGSGHEFDGRCGPQCQSKMQLHKKRERRHKTQALLSSSLFPTSCLMCRQRNTVQSFSLLDVEKRSLIPCIMCTKHRVPSHILRNIQDRRGLDLYFRLQKDVYSKRSETCVCVGFVAFTFFSWGGTASLFFFSHFFLLFFGWGVAAAAVAPEWGASPARTARVQWRPRALGWSDKRDFRHHPRGKFGCKWRRKKRRAQPRAPECQNPRHTAFFPWWGDTRIRLCRSRNPQREFAWKSADAPSRLVSHGSSAAH